jgi:hypothetical protein
MLVRQAQATFFIPLHMGTSIFSAASSYSIKQHIHIFANREIRMRGSIYFISVSI